MNTPKPVCEQENVTVLWNQEVHIDRDVMANRSYRITKSRKEKMCILIVVAIPKGRNIMHKEAEKN